MKKWIKSDLRTVFFAVLGVEIAHWILSPLISMIFDWVRGA